MSGIRIATLLSAALLSVLTARFLGPAGRGTYALPAIDASIAVTFSVGISSAIAYFLLNRKAGSTIVSSASRVLALFAVGGSLLTVATAIISHSAWAIAPAIAQMLAYGGYSVACGYFMGRDRVRDAGLLNGALSVATLLFVTLALLFARGSAVAAVAAWVASSVVVGSVGLAIVVQDARRLSGTHVTAIDLMRFSGKAGTLNVANLLNYRVDIYIVAMLMPVSALGLYTIAVFGAESALSLALAIGQVTLPRIGSSTRTEAGIFAARCLRNCVFLAAIFGLAAFWLAPEAVRIALGPAYAAVVLPFRILIVGAVAASTSAVISNYFMLNLGRAHVPLATATFSTVVCASLSFALIPRLGLVGAAIASTIAYVASQALAVAWFCKESGIEPCNVLLINGEDVSVYRRIVRHAALRDT